MGMEDAPFDSGPDMGSVWQGKVDLFASCLLFFSITDNDAAMDMDA